MAMTKKIFLMYLYKWKNTGMKIGKTFNKVINSPYLSGSIFLASGGYKIYDDYKVADDKYKKKFLIKDSVVLSGAALGMLAERGLTNKAHDSKWYHKTIHKASEKILHLSKVKNVQTSLDYTKAILKNFLSSFTLFASGILGALGMDYLLSKTGFEQPNKITRNHVHEKTKIGKYIDSNIERIVDKDTKEEMYSRITDMPQMKIFTTGLIGTQAIELAKEKEFDKRLHHTTKCMINDSLLPLFFLSTSSTLTKNMRTIYRVPIIFTSLVGGTMLGKKMLNKYVEKLND